LDHREVGGYGCNHELAEKLSMSAAASREVSRASRSIQRGLFVTSSRASSIVTPDRQGGVEWTCARVR